MPSDLDESIIKDKLPSTRVKKLARLKAEVVANKLIDKQDYLIIAADTMVYLPSTPGVEHYRMIGKPKDKKEAKKILQELSSSTHWLYTGICVIKIDRTRQIFLDFDKTKVVFRKISDQEIDEYVQNPEVLNHAGGYTIEKSTVDEGFIKEIYGSYSNVLGLPMEKLKEILSMMKVI